jgi:HEAT repeat protein
VPQVDPQIDQDVIPADDGDSEAAEPAAPKPEYTERLPVETIVDDELQRLRIGDLRAKLSDPNADARFAAVAQLAEIGAEDAEARTVLVTALSDANEQVVVAARKVLREIGAGAVPELTAALAGPSPDIRRHAAQTLALFDASDARPAFTALSDALRDEDAALRAAAVVAIGHFPSDDVVPMLVECLLDKEDTVRAAAARTLGAIGPEAQGALSQLRAATRDENFWVSRAAKQAIRSIAPGPPKVYP